MKMSEILLTMGLAGARIVSAGSLGLLAYLGYVWIKERKKSRHLGSLMVNVSRGRNDLWKRSGY